MEQDIFNIVETWIWDH